MDMIISRSKLSERGSACNTGRSEAPPPPPYCHKFPPISRRNKLGEYTTTSPPLLVAPARQPEQQVTSDPFSRQQQQNVLNIKAVHIVVPVGHLSIY